MMHFLTNLALTLVLICGTQAHAATGIDSVAYLWVIALVLIGLILLVFMTLKFLRGIRRDSLKHHKNQED